MRRLQPLQANEASRNSARKEHYDYGINLAARCSHDKQDPFKEFSEEMFWALQINYLRQFVSQSNATGNSFN